MNKKIEQNQTIEINLHLYSVSEAKKQLKLAVDLAPKGTKEIVVIHGHNRGTALRDMVRKDFKHKRVERKILSLNQGITTFMLSNKK